MHKSYKRLLMKPEYYAHPDKPFIYVNIPKNASSSIKQALFRVGYKNVQGVSNQKGFAVIREPFERYQSGLYQYWNHRTADFEAWVKKQKHPKIFDEHTEHQATFLKGFTNIELLPMSKVNYLTELLAGQNQTFNINVSERPDISHLLDRESILRFYNDDVALYIEAEKGLL